MADVLYEQFRVTADPLAKRLIMAETSKLLHRNLALSVPLGSSDLTHQTVVLARMTRRSGQLQDFQDLLEKAFNVCYEALLDKVGWNDANNLHELAKVLSSLPGLETESRMLFSASFSKLRPDDAAAVTNAESTVNGDGASEHATSRAEQGFENGTSGGDLASEDDSEDEGDEEEEGENDEDAKDSDDEEESNTGSEGDADGNADGHDDSDDDGDDDGADDAGSQAAEEDNDPLPTNEGDLIEETLYCSGQCDLNLSFRAWKGRSMYLCLTCYDTLLCEECYQKRLAYDSGAEVAAGITFCGKGHKHIKGPLEGWAGIKDGTIMIEGEQDVAFDSWLSELKEVKWKEAWEKFWLLDE